ncbi:MAG: hypothetical protein A3H91_01025 [Gammaproteobacteria bacterium RIFCSPLOWO2_02_FULL_61_13]|nr:MAG: hypothetical protein A3H91_01025 [Gammaproteobacteria bacterium RIFCSPLOWO2_02_FULL_61_13]
MSLRVRLTIMISTLFVLVCMGAGMYVVDNARRAVRDEMQSTARLTLDLLEAELLRGGAARDPWRTRQFLDRLSSMGSTRHMRITIRQHGASASLATDSMTVPRQISAPAWFARLVSPQDLVTPRILTQTGMPQIEIELRADPADEIAEAWRETRGVLYMMFLFAGLVMGLIYFRLGRDLAPIDSILAGLQGIEQGDYQLRLPAYRTTELGRISDKFNHMAQVLLQAREENRRLSQRSLEIQEQERRLLARELHDELGQSLTAIKAMAVATAAAPDIDSSRLRVSMGEIARVADHTYDVARQLMQRLRPPVLDVLGLGAALQDLVDRWNSAGGGGFCRLTITGDLQALSDVVGINLFRIIQEALTNVARHATAEKVDVNLRVGQGNDVDLAIVDDGAGFEPEAARPGLGLLGMRERAVALGGTCALSSAPGHGVRIRVTLPAATGAETA